MSQDPGKLFDGRSFKERSEWQLDSEYLFNLREQMYGYRRIPAQIKVILIGSNGFDTQNLLPELRQLPCGIVTHWNIVNLRHRFCSHEGLSSRLRSHSPPLPRLGTRVLNTYLANLLQSVDHFRPFVNLCK